MDFFAEPVGADQSKKQPIRWDRLLKKESDREFNTDRDNSSAVPRS